MAEKKAPEKPKMVDVTLKHDCTIAGKEVAKGKAKVEERYVERLRYLGALDE